MNYLPSEKCLICKSSLDVVKGRRLIITGIRGLFIDRESRSHSDREYSYKIEGSNSYLHFKGSWTSDQVQKALEEATVGLHPWFCQKCGGRSCRKCGAVYNYPMATDVLNDDGTTSHCAIFHFQPKCTNLICAETDSGAPEAFLDDDLINVIISEDE